MILLYDQRGIAAKKKELIKKIEEMEHQLAELLDNSEDNDLNRSVIYQKGFRFPGNSKNCFKIIYRLCSNGAGTG